MFSSFLPMVFGLWICFSYHLTYILLCKYSISHTIGKVIKPCISKMLNVLEGKKQWLTHNTVAERDRLLQFTMPQWLYFFRLKSAIWTGQNLVS